MLGDNTKSISYKNIFLQENVLISFSNKYCFVVNKPGLDNRLVPNSWN